jgi:Tol biopolymer transport system component
VFSIRAISWCTSLGAVAMLVGVVALPPGAAADPDHQGRIAFQENSRVYVMDSDGSNLVELTNDASSRNPLWSPDGTRLAITSTRDRVPGESGVDIYVIWLSGGRVDRVTWDGTGGPPSSWSHDGESIVYVSGGGIYVVNIADGTKTPITSIPEPDPVPYTRFHSPTFSPDGSRIVYVEISRTYEGGWPIPGPPTPVETAAVFVVDADGSHVTRITNSLAPAGSRTKWTDDDRWPAWSPDGTQIVFSSDQGCDGCTDLFVINTDGTGRHRITDGTDKTLFPAWSPDGTRIAWSGDMISFVADSDGTNKTPLGDPSGDIGVSSPVWSSDGSRIAVLASIGIATVNPDGSDFIVLIPRRANPHWQPVFPPVGLFDTTAGIWHLRDWGGETTNFYYGNPGDSPFVGDWDCDGVDTPGLYRESDGYVYLRNANTQGIADITFFFGNPSDVPLAGDFNGDGCDTVSVYRPPNQTFYIVNKLGENNGGLGAAEYSFLFGNPGDKPVVGDWDGDGIDEIGLHRETTGFFYYRNTLTTGVADGQFFFGNPGDLFVAGDWGVVDGIETPAMFRPSNDTFYFRYTLTQGNADSQFVWTGAGNSWLPVAGDFTLD